MIVEGSQSVVSAKVCIPQMHSLPRERLDAVLASLWEHRLGLVIAPAGSGKTTLMARFGSLAGVPVAWYRAESWDATTSALLDHLETAFVRALGELPRGWSSVEQATRALQSWPGERALLVVDDLHALEATSAEGALERLIDYLPPAFAVLAASRSYPGFNLSRLRLSGGLLELGSEDLRFRSWEVERLFRDYYREPFPPEELAALARRTEGWAAGLQLYHLATRGRPASERWQILDSLATRRLTREYLTRNVLEQLPQEVRRFLVDTCVLGRLSSPVCDELLGQKESRRLLESLERQQILTCALDGEGCYRCHEVLRCHLEEILVEEVGETEARARFRRAGQLLESAAALSDALRSYCHAEDWEAVDRLLGQQGEQVAQRAGVWIDALPPAVLRHDPWLLLASARHQRSEGCWRAAMEAYDRAAATFAGSEAARICQQERAALVAWFEPTPGPAMDWSGILRKAVAHDPLTASEEALRLPGPGGQLAAGLAMLLAGQIGNARARLALVADSPQAGPALSVAARLGVGVADLLARDQQGSRELELAVENAERLGLGWLARVGRGAVVLDYTPGAAAEAEAVSQACERDRDEWGRTIVALLHAWGAVYAGASPASILEQVASECRRLGAGVLEAWARGLLALALARLGAPEARAVALQAENVARSTGTLGAELFPYLALTAVEPERALQYGDLARAVQQECGLHSPAIHDPSSAGPGKAVEPKEQLPTVRIRCFGGFAISIRGDPVNLSTIKPRVRALLRLLAAHVGSPVHREVLQEAFWPEADRKTGARCLHVAVSSLRQALQPGVARGASSFLMREGDAYRLAFPPDARIDILEFQQALAAGRACRGRHARKEAIHHFREALALYTGDLLPEDGPAEWLLQLQERYRHQAVEAAQALAELLLETGDPSAAAHACMAGLSLDRYHDPLWRLLIGARDGAGDPAAASRARLEYRQVLTELGLAGSASGAAASEPSTWSPAPQVLPSFVGQAISASSHP